MEKIKLSSHFNAVILLVSLLCINGCSYRLSGGGTFPAGVQSVCVSIFENRSAETGIERQLANDMIYEFTRTGRKVVSDPASGDSVVSGVIKSVSIETLSYKTGQVANENRIRVVLDVKLKNKKGDVLWSGDNIVDDQAYVADADNQANGRNKLDALAKLSKRMAEDIQNRMTADF